MQGFLSSNLTIEFKRGHFKLKQNMFVERRTHSTCKAGDFVYVCGGINSKGEPLNSCEKYSLVYEKWVKIANMNIPKSHLSICNVNNEFIFSIGGENRYDSILDMIEKYNINMDSWETMNIKIPIKLECVSCIQLKNEILILGGYSCEHGSLKTVFSYDYSKNTIRKLNYELSQPGWSIYMPMKIGQNVHVFFGGEEEFPPHHILYSNQ
jgi:hypothetical protein